MGKELLKNAPMFGHTIVGFGRTDFDITDSSKLKNAIEKSRADIVINTTAYNLVTSAEDSPEEAMVINYEAVANMAKICHKNAIKFITFSTDYVFDGSRGTFYKEDDTPSPLQVYGKSKLAGENAALQYNSNNSFVIRTCGLYGGKTGSPGKRNFVLNILKEAHDKEIIEVSSEQVVNPTYASDLSKATLELLQKKAKPDIYHLTNEGYCSWYEFTREIFRLAGITKKLLPVDRNCRSGKIQRPRFSALKNVKAKVLGVELPSWQEGLRSYVQYLEKE